MTKFSVVVLAGGLGTRLRSKVGETPKALVEILGRPFLDWKIEQLIQGGASGIYLLVGKGGRALYDFIAGKQFEVPIAVIPDGPRLLGTLGAVKQCLPLVAGSGFVLTYGDNLLTYDLRELVSVASANARTTMVVTDAIGPSDSANVRLGEDLVLAYGADEPGDLTFVDYGYSWIEKTDFMGSTAATPSDLKGIWKALAQERRLGALRTSLGYLEIGTPEALNLTVEALRSQPRP